MKQWKNLNDMNTSDGDDHQRSNETSREGIAPRNLVAMSDSEEEDWRFFQSYVSKVRIKLGPRRGLSEVRIRSASRAEKKSA